MAEKEYIERGAALRRLLNDCVAKYPCSFYVGLSAAADEIKQLPTADVVEVRHGYWIESDNLESFNTRGWKRYKKVICSNCKKSNYNNHSNYCPNCGAKMDGKGGEDL